MWLKIDQKIINHIEMCELIEDFEFELTVFIHAEELIEMYKQSMEDEDNELF